MADKYYPGDIVEVLNSMYKDRVGHRYYVQCVDVYEPSGRQKITTGKADDGLSASYHFYVEQIILHKRPIENWLKHYHQWLTHL